MKKIDIKYIVIIIVFLIYIPSIKAVSNPYKETNSLYSGYNCTWYAWKMAYEKAGVALPGWGNAKNWYTDAQKSGYQTGTTPQANSIVVWGTWTSYGHVGYVERVTDTAIYVWDSTGPCADKGREYEECMSNSMSEEGDKACWDNAKKVACEYSLFNPRHEVTGYIYLNGAKSNTSSKSSSKKSSNNNLKDLRIDGYDINFQKDILDYNLNVEFDVENVNIIAEADSSKASVTGTGDQELNIGKNIFKIVVKAEDGTKKEYNINVFRKMKTIEEQKVIKINSEDKKENKKNNKVIVVTIMGVGLLITIVTIGFVSIRKKNKLK